MAGLFVPDIKKVGGAEVQLYLLASELAKDRRFEINIITSSTVKNISRKNNLILLPLLPELKYGRFLKTIWFCFRDMFNLHRAIKKINPDLLFLSVNNFETICSLFFAKMLNKKTIYRVAHDTESRGVSLRSSKVVAFPFRMALKMTKPYIICQHTKQKEDLRKYLNLNSTVFYSVYKINKETISPQQKKSILWVGRYVKFKQPNLFLELAESLPTRTFIMICNGKLPLNFMEKAKKIKNLRLFNYIPFSEIDAFFKGAKIFINTSTEEGFPNTFIQAAKNGTPILSLRVNPENFFQKYKHGFVTKSISNMRKYICQLFEDDALYLEMSQNAIKYANEIHDIEKNILKIKKIIYKLTV